MGNSETGAPYGVRPYYLFVGNTDLDMGIHQIKVHELGADIGIVFRKSLPCFTDKATEIEDFFHSQLNIKKCACNSIRFGDEEFEAQIIRYIEYYDLFDIEYNSKESGILLLCFFSDLDQSHFLKGMEGAFNRYSC
ncbi:hypothetical protein MG293_006365 [Ovis ammon polii]|uniref:Uncharacterized protein n=1 Tax=Ovis ammon polii TaxID=230172 RepID=A0AAD4UEE5_OVIAM|nr:hypothetical protein MG293_006365 [Ovis ammon polii]